MSHNQASKELLDFQPWIDEVAQVPFLEGREKSWEGFYDWYPELLDRTELRFVLEGGKTTYGPEFTQVLPAIRREWIEPLGLDAGIPQVPYPACTHILHEGSGCDLRSISVSDHGIHQCRPLVVGGNYTRSGKRQETGVQLHPLSLVNCILNARRVVGSESSVAYIASMLGVPFAMLYREGQTFDRVQKGESDWNYYYGVGEPGNLYLKFPLSDEDRARLLEWALD